MNGRQNGPEREQAGDRGRSGRLRAALERAITETLGPDPDIPLVTRVVEDHPAHALIAASRNADLLVVGSRGHGTFEGMLVGSVSQHCVQHAECPVVVVRHSRQ